MKNPIEVKKKIDRARAELKIFWSLSNDVDTGKPYSEDQNQAMNTLRERSPLAIAVVGAVVGAIQHTHSHLGVEYNLIELYRLTREKMSAHILDELENAVTQAKAPGYSELPHAPRSPRSRHMTKTQNQSELENFFGVQEELDAKRARGDLDNLHYRIKKEHIRSVLSQRAPLAAQALTLTEGQLLHWTALTPEECRALEELIEWDYILLEAWREEHNRRNLRALSLKLLAALEAVEKEPLPTPRPAIMEAVKRMRNHQIGTPTDDTKGYAKTGSYVFHSDPSGKTAGTMVGPGGGVGEPDDGASVGSGGGGGPAYDSRIHHEPRRVADLVAGNPGIKFGPGASPYVR